MRLMSSLLRVAVVLFVVVTGCSGGGSKSPSGAVRAKNPMPEEPYLSDAPPGQYGGRLVLSMLGSPKTFNAMITNDSPTNDVISGAVWEGLLDFDNVTQEVKPGLLSSWEHSADGLVWTLKLRKGLKWSDGHPLTVDDVLFTTAVLQDTSLHINAASLLTRSGSFPPFAKVDDTTFTVTLKKPFGPFLHAISGFRVIPKHKLEGAWKAGRFAQTWGLDTPPDSLVGSGPFTIARYVPNESITLKPNPWFYRVDSKQQRLPYLDELIWVIVPDQNAELIKFKSGETDGLYARSEDVEGLKGEAEAGHFTVSDLGPEY
ncbi:MAG TPA: ABC transporter substrate-binding protein, partial [Candidatus Eisenbacteria bacterium]